MNNFDNFENSSYESARKLDYKFNDYLNFIVKGAIVYFQILLVFCQEIFLKFIKLFSFAKPKSIDGQIALVTGGANGLGRAIAFRLAKESCNVVIIDLNLKEAQKAATEIAEKFNVKTVAYKVDVTNYEAVQQLKKDIESILGPVDILVNNAGVVPSISLREGKPSDLQKIIDLNVSSHFWTTRTFLDEMIKNKRGHIVGISSLGGLIPFPYIIYATTKFGITGFMGALYDELCVFDQDEFIKTTCVYPAFINTRKQMCDLLDQVYEAIPRMSPEYVADEVVKGMLVDKKDIILPYGIGIMQILNYLPSVTSRFAKKKLVDCRVLKEAEQRQQQAQQ